MFPVAIPLVGFVVCLTACVVLYCREHDISPIRELTRRWLSLTPFGHFAVLAFAIVMVIHGSTKWHFTFENGVRDNGSYCTNDTIHAAWTYSPAYAQYALRAAYRDLTITNEVGVCIDEWHELDDALVSDGSADWQVPNATNMEVACYAKHVQPQLVVTNGVYHVSGVMRSLATTNSASPSYVTPGVKIYAYIPDGVEEVLTPTNEPPDSVSGLRMNIQNGNGNNNGESREE